MPSSPAPETVFRGLGISGGIAIGKGYPVDVMAPSVPETSIPAAGVDGEISRLHHAIDDARRELEDMKNQAQALPGEAAKDAIPLIDAHLAMLRGGRLVRGAEDRVRQQKINAEAAVSHERQGLSTQFRQVGDAYIAARAEDLESVADRVLRHLTGRALLPLDAVPQGGIVLAWHIAPADAVLLDPARFGGLATVQGGAAGHTAIMARSLGLPAVMGLPPAFLDAAKPGIDVILDGDGGEVILSPAPETLARYAARSAEERRLAGMLLSCADAPALTADGARITLLANIDRPQDAGDALRAGAEGIGLFRTEYLFMNRDTLPTEAEQCNAMATAVHAMQGRPVTLRTLDIGGDKIARAFSSRLAEEDNPALGLRAIRLSLKERDSLLVPQFRAMLQAAAEGPVQILLPMVTQAKEVREARQILRACLDSLKREGRPAPESLPPLGVMIETPAAALSADSLAIESDFFAIGTNDLVQYTVAIDRGNDQVAAFYDPLHPGVLRLLQFAIEAGTRAGIPVSICGEMASDTRFTPLLLGLGLRAFSVGKAALPRLKDRISRLSLKKAQQHAQAVMNQYDAAEITRIVDSFPEASKKNP